MEDYPKGNLTINRYEEMGPSNDRLDNEVQGYEVEHTHFFLHDSPHCE